MTLRDRVGGFLSLGNVADAPVVPDRPAPVSLEAYHNRLWTTAARGRRDQARAIDSFTDMPGLEEQLLAVQGIVARPWRAPSIREALGVPAIFGAVNLIRNLVGSMSMRALRNEVELAPDDRPRIIVRPDPFCIPRDFFGGTAYNIATRGEAWWWTAARDGDGAALSLLNIPPHEVTVEEDRLDLRYPIVRWRNKVIPREDIHQLVYTREPGSLRGYGPLQSCGAAISVAVESQEWAANFFAEDGGYPSVVIKSALELGEDPVTGANEADTLRDQWMNKPHNTPRVIDPGIEDVSEFGINQQGAQMLGARSYQDGQVAVMFNIPGPILEYAMQGSSVAYQNVGTEFEKMLRQCLRPHYLESMEQTMSDLIPRAITARFNTAALTLSDVKTRYDTYGVGIDKGIIDAEEARRFEGLAPGDVENAAVPFSPPAAIPTQLPIEPSGAAPYPVAFSPRSTLGAIEPVRCTGTRVLKGILRPCGKLLAEAGPFTGSCPRCRKVYDGVVA